MLESKRAPIRTYRDLRVYQQSMALLGPIHELVLGFPEYERYALADQMRRSFGAEYRGGLRTT
jgi:hypothetical protein